MRPIGTPAPAYSVSYRLDDARIGAVSITYAGRTLQEGRDFTVDLAAGVVTFIGVDECGAYEVFAPSWPKPAKPGRRRAQWKAERSSKAWRR